MKTILATTYALNPYKGSEDGMGFNFVMQIARFNKVCCITRKNNKPHIDRYFAEHPNDLRKNIRFYYYDLPYFLRFYKKKARGAMLYFYLWQLFMPLFVLSKKIKFDIAHNLNFHADWAPTLLWVLKKPTIWGPIGHHPKIPKAYIKPVFGITSYFKNRVNWLIKLWFWNFDILVYFARKKADLIICMNKVSERRIHKKCSTNTLVMPSVASENQIKQFKYASQNTFNVISVGRFVELKGFDVTIRSFAKFLHSKDAKTQKNIRLTLVGKGPLKKHLITLIDQLNIKHNVKIIDWIDRKDLFKLYAKSAVFLFPSHEGAGMVVSEALSFGLPVICFDNAGPGEFIHERCGAKVKYEAYASSIDKFAAALNQYFASAHLLKTHALNARKHFLNTFEWNNRGETLRDIYQNIDA